MKRKLAAARPAGKKAKQASANSTARSRTEMLCPLTTDRKLRAAADRQTDALAQHFPPGMSRPALRALAEAGITRLAALTKVREADLTKVHGMGPKGIRSLREALAERGQSFLK